MRSSRNGRPRDLAVAVAFAVALPLAVAGCTTTAARPTAASAARPTTSSTIRGVSCTVDQLSATVDSSRSGQQTIEPSIVLTNQSTRACTMRGTPEVAFTDRAGERRIGPDALQEPSQPSPELTLQPGAADPSTV